MNLRKDHYRTPLCLSGSLGYRGRSSAVAVASKSGGLGPRGRRPPVPTGRDDVSAARPTRDQRGRSCRRASPGRDVRCKNEILRCGVPVSRARPSYSARSLGEHRRRTGPALPYRHGPASCDGLKRRAAASHSARAGFEGVPTRRVRPSPFAPLGAVFSSNSTTENGKPIRSRARPLPGRGGLNFALLQQECERNYSERWITRLVCR